MVRAAAPEQLTGCVCHYLPCVAVPGSLACCCACAAYWNRCLGLTSITWALDAYRVLKSVSVHCICTCAASSWPSREQCRLQEASHARLASSMPAHWQCSSCSRCLCRAEAMTQSSMSTSMPMKECRHACTPRQCMSHLTTSELHTRHLEWVTHPATPSC